MAQTEILYKGAVTIGYRQVPIKKIIVNIMENDNDHEFVFVDGGDGKKVMTVF